VQTSASRIDAFYPPVGSTYGESHYFPQVGNGANTQDKLFQTTEVDTTSTQITNALSTPQSMVGYVSEPLPSLGDYNAITLGDNVCTICLGTGVYKSYKNKGDLSRHTKEHSVMAGGLLCTETLCNRSVDGNGFTRKDKLQSHLEKKHKMSRAQASYRVGQVTVRARRGGEHSA
jgi:hypothetical protein